MQLRPHSDGVTARRSTIAIAGGLALVILTVLPRSPHRQDVTRQYPPGPSATEESGISEPVGLLESPARAAPADGHRQRTKVPTGHLSASEGRDSQLTIPAVQHAPASISKVTRIGEDSAASPDGPIRSGVLTPRNLESKFGGEARVEEGSAGVHSNAVETQKPCPHPRALL